METLTNSISWFEIPVADFARAKKFYSTIYDYHMPEMTMGLNTLGFLLHEQGKGIGGAIVQGPGYEPTQKGSLVYLNGGRDLSVILDRVPAAGGKILLAKTLVAPEMGYYAIILDTEGNRVALHSMS